MRPIKKDSADQEAIIRIIDSTDGTPEEAVEHDTAGIALWFRRTGGLRNTILPVALAALDSVHASGGIEHIDDGYYRLDLPDPAVATGSNEVTVGGAVTGMIVIGTSIPLVDYDPYDSVRMGMTTLPNAAANAAGGLPISVSGSLDLDSVLSGNIPQSADNNTILAHVDYGNAQLVRSTTPANKLDVSATGEAGLDFDNIKDATGAHTLTNITVPTTTVVTSGVVADVTSIDGVAQRATDLAEIAQYLFANTATLTDIIADNSVIAKMLATSGLIANYSSVDDALQSIRDAITETSPQSHSATANNETTGTLDSGTYADTATVNNTYYQVSPAGVAVGGFGLNCDLTFNIGVGRVPSNAVVTGYFDSGAQRTVQIWFYDYIAAEYVQVSNSQNDFNNAGSNQSFPYALTQNMVQVSDGEMKIRFTSTSTTIGDDWYCDYIAVTSIEAAAGGLTADIIQAAVWARSSLTADHDKDTLGYVISNIFIVQGIVGTVTSASQFIIDADATGNDAYNGNVIVIEDETTGFYETRRIVDYIGATKEVFLDRDVSFTPAANEDHYYIMGTGYADVNITHISGTAQTANDNGTDINEILTNLITISGAINNVPTRAEATSDKDEIIADIISISGVLENVPTRTEATADKDEILVQVNANETKIDSISGVVADIQTNTEEIQTDTEDIQNRLGISGASLAAIPWNTTWDTEVQSEVTDALNVYDPPTRAEATADKDEIIADIISISGAIDSVPTRVEATSDKNEIIAEVNTNETKIDSLSGVVSTSQTTVLKLDDTLELDGAVYRFTANALEEAPSASISGVSVPTASQIADAVWDEMLNTHTDSGSTGEAVNRLNDIQTDTEDIQNRLGISGASLSALPWNAAWDTEVQSEVTDALNAYDPPTRAEATSDKDEIIADIISISGVLENVPTRTEATADKDEILVEVNANETKIDITNVTIGKLDDTLELDGTTYRFTSGALAEAPSSSSSGGDATLANQSTMITHMTDMKGATFESTDSLEAIRNRGDVAWVTGSGLSGSNTVTITVTTSGAVPIQDAKVEIWNTALTSFYTSANTDVDGEVSFTSDDAVYKVKISKGGYTFTATYDLTVSGDTTEIYTGTVGSPSADFSG